MKGFFTTSEALHRKLFFILSLLVVTTLPFSIPLNGLAIILLSANWLMEGNWRKKYQMLIENKPALLFVALYLVHIVGLLYTENIRQGFSELEKKVAFVIFPVIFSTTPYLDRTVVQKILNWFVAICLIAVIICLLNGLYFFFQGDSSYLFYHKLGSAINFNHAIYFSLYVGFSIFIVLYQLKSRWFALTTKAKALYLFISCLFMLFLILLSSKTLIPTVLLMLGFFIGRIIYERKGILIGITALLLCLSLSVLIVYKSPNIRQRFKEVLIDRYEQTNPLLLDDYQYYHFTGGAIRLAIWKMTIEIIHQQNAWLFGVGTGDSQDVLTGTYIKKHVYPGDKALGIEGFLHYNAHNQFMQFFLMFGVVGALLFIWILILLFKIAIKHSSTFLSLLILFTAFSLTESTLHVQKGIVPFLFFSSLFAAIFLNTAKTRSPRERLPSNHSARNLD